MNTIHLYDSEELKQQRAVAILQERARLARELHDTIGQVLGYVRLQAYTAQQLLERGQTAEADALLSRLVEVAESSQAEVRDQIFGLSMQLPLNARVKDLVSSLRSYIDTFSRRSSLQVTFSANPDLLERSIAPDAEAQALRIVQEALINANKHGTAQRAGVTLSLAGDFLHGVIEDDGKGFSPENTPPTGAPRFGLRIMSERAQEVGGQLQILTSPGKGTKIVFDIPCAPADAPETDTLSTELVAKAA
jgi:signal transduction histidine kinase